MEKQQEVQCRFTGTMLRIRTKKTKPRKLKLHSKIYKKEQDQIFRNGKSTNKN